MLSWQQLPKYVYLSFPPRTKLTTLRRPTTDADAHQLDESTIFLMIAAAAGSRCLTAHGLWAMLSQEVSALTIHLGGRLQSFPTRMPIAVELVAVTLRRVMARSAIRSR